MNRFLFILFLVFLVGFVIQQSQVIQRVKVVDPVLRVPKEEYHLNRENLTDYLHGLAAQTGDFFKSVPKKIKQGTSPPKR